MNPRTILFVAVLSLIVRVEVRAQLSLDEFLNSANEDPEVKTFDDQIDYLNKKPYRLAPVRELQFRTQNRELIQTQQEYAIRVSPANPLEARRQNAYFKEMNNSLGWEKQLALKDALLDRYLTAVEYLYYAILNNLTLTNKTRLEQQIRILEQQSGSRYFDAEDYVDLKTDQLDFLIEEEEISFELSNQMSKIVRTYPTAHAQKIEWDFNTVISTERMKRVLDSIAQADITSARVAYYEQQIRVAQSEYKLEQSNFNVGFFQTSYDRRRVNQERNPFSVSFGVTIPVFNPNKGDMAKTKLEAIEAQYDFKEESYQSETDKIILKEKVLSLILRIENLEKKIKELESSTIAQTLSTIKGGDPIAIIQFNQRITKLHGLYYKVKRELFLSYVEYLYSMDALQQRPLINFFSPSLSRLD